MSDFQYTVEFRPVKQNAYGDALSRLPTPQQGPLGEEELAVHMLTMSQVDETFIPAQR